MSVMEIPRVTLPDPPCRTSDMAKKQAVSLQIDSDPVNDLERVAARFGTAPAIADEAFSNRLDQWKLEDGRRAVAEHFAESTHTEAQIAEADAWFDGVQAEATRMLADGDDHDDDQDVEDRRC